jgi:hypothetical protein
VAGVRRARRGGPRVGAGRPRGSGGPSEDVRRNRVAVLLTDAELVKLQRLAEARELPLGTVAYELLERGLRRAT